MFHRAIHWFRRDLRLIDNHALYEACLQSKEVMPVFVFDRNILKKLKNKKDRRVLFIYKSLEELKEQLNKIGSDLFVLYGEPLEVIPEFIAKNKIQSVFTNKDYEPYAIKRDSDVSHKLKERGVSFHSYKDQVIFEEREVLTGAQEAYKVFTPYKNAWLKKATEKDFINYQPKLTSFFKKENYSGSVPFPSLNEIGFEADNLILPAGRMGALEKLNQFSKKLNHYDIMRNSPELEGTSQISIYLRFGVVSIRELFRYANQSSTKGAEVWRSELIWREFYHMILSQFPHVEKHAFKKECDQVSWENNSSHFQKWCQGQTGYPIVDAAMRYFNQTGWMHNRLRMIVASFLTKDLLIDYKKGEEYFAENLLDFDLAANNGGWQWSASTGCDAQPYFRVFNPETQSKNFDPEGNFIRKHCPELKNFSSKYIHAPHKSEQWEQQKAQCRIGVNYPFPIVEHEKQRLKAIALFSEKSEKKS